VSTAVRFARLKQARKVSELPAKRQNFKFLLKVIVLLSRLRIAPLNVSVWMDRAC
jgi:hypothetical protein